jgi:NhaA family Na+:H+ antiporter
MQRFGVRSKLAYIAPALVVWGGTYAAGVHPTIAGVVVGLITPVRAWLGPDGFVEGVRERLDRLERAIATEPGAAHWPSALREFELARREAVAPSEALIEKLHPFVAYGIMPLFALANAGVTFGAVELDATATRVVLGAGVGLVVGKPIGVLAAIGITVRLGLGKLPIGIGMRQLVVLGLVAGVGFTMALFVAQLAFTNPAHLDAAKFGVFGGSLVAAVIGLAAGRVLLPARVEPGAAVSADEAEDSTEK